MALNVTSNINLKINFKIYNEEGSVDVLLTILELYTKRNDDLRDPDTDPDLHLIGMKYLAYLLNWILVHKMVSSNNNNFLY